MVNKINNFSFGSIVINNKKYTRDILILADGRVEPRQGGIWIFGAHDIKKQEIEKLLNGEPEIVIVGTGTINRARLSPAVENWTKQKKVKLTVLPSHEAVTKFKELVGEGKKVAAIIHITC